ncbi:NirV precursor [Shewanella sediminis HAW-EB3]|uniref:NirV n=1 Tax=Shewanella sediminis (strain HAW-EB3) TaxID=425104 RepID=A8FTD5_SHESH|nr:PEGA domain-containing protein [Shewanella sediminis]ABV36108.1 NirV precursor [Shewanella sediminis HAW-EB3]
MTNRVIQTFIFALSPFFLQATAGELSIPAAHATDNPVSVLSQKIKGVQRQQTILAEEIIVYNKKQRTLLSQQEKAATAVLDAEKNRKKAQKQLDNQFKALLNDPSADITATKNRYQQAWQSLQDSQKEKQLIAHSITEQTAIIEGSKKRQASISHEIAQLKELKKGARVKRIEKELTFNDSVDVSHTVTCNLKMTLAECAEQGKILTMQKAVRVFKAKLIDSLTESELAKVHADDVSFNIHVMNSQTLKNEFNGSSNFVTQIQSEMRSHPSNIAACQLLELKESYCVEPKSKSVSIATDNNYTSSKKWLSVTIRSNVYGDRVVVDGVDYGSTPMDVMLPSGPHQFKISKKGYQTYQRELTIDRDQTVWTELYEQKRSDGWQTTAVTP